MGALPCRLIVLPLFRDGLQCLCHNGRASPQCAVWLWETALSAGSGRGTGRWSHPSPTARPQTICRAPQRPQRCLHPQAPMLPPALFQHHTHSRASAYVTLALLYLGLICWWNTDLKSVIDFICLSCAFGQFSSFLNEFLSVSGFISCVRRVALHWVWEVLYCFPAIDLPRECLQ